jgi:hypothetical protein
MTQIIFIYDAGRSSSCYTEAFLRGRSGRPTFPAWPPAFPRHLRISRTGSLRGQGNPQWADTDVHKKWHDVREVARLLIAHRIGCQCNKCFKKLAHLLLKVLRLERHINCTICNNHAISGANIANCLPVTVRVPL